MLWIIYRETMVAESAGVNSFKIGLHVFGDIA